MAKTEIVYPKNVRAKIAMDFRKDNFPTPMAIEKIIIRGVILELPAKQHCQIGQVLRYSKVPNKCGVQITGYVGSNLEIK